MSEDFAVVEMRVEDVIPYEKNPRHNEHAVEKVAKSIEAYGWQQNIVVDANNVVIVGHTRLEAAKRLGLETVPVKVADLSAEAAKAYRLADNRVAQDSSWDAELLSFELEDLRSLGYDLELTGFDAKELADLIVPDANFAPGHKADQSSLDSLTPKIVTCPNCRHEFDPRIE